MSTKQQEILNTQMNAENQNTNKEDSSKLIEREPIEGTPFWIIGKEEEGYFLTFGKYQISETLESKFDVETYLVTNKWEIILKMILCMKTVTENEINNTLKKV